MLAHFSRCNLFGRQFIFYFFSSCVVVMVIVTKVHCLYFRLNIFYFIPRKKKHPQTIIYFSFSVKMFIFIFFFLLNFFVIALFECLVFLFVIYFFKKNYSLHFVQLFLVANFRSQNNSFSVFIFIFFIFVDCFNKQTKTHIFGREFIRMT